MTLVIDDQYYKQSFAKNIDMDHDFHQTNDFSFPNITKELSQESDNHVSMINEQETFQKNEVYDELRNIEQEENNNKDAIIRLSDLNFDDIKISQVSLPRNIARKKVSYSSS